MDEDRGFRRQLLLSEFDQAWQHMRHIETQRLQYTGFFFTLTLGAVALVGSQQDGGGIFGQRASTLHALLAALIIVTSSLYLSIWRMGSQLRHYRRTLYIIRTDHHEEPSALLKNQFEHERKARNAKLIQIANQGIFLFFVVTLWVAEVSMCLSSLPHEARTVDVLITSFSLAGSTIGVALVVVVTTWFSSFRFGRQPPNEWAEQQHGAR